jgi:hypothetical protein
MNIVRNRNTMRGLGDDGFLPSDMVILDSSGQPVNTDAEGNPIPTLIDPSLQQPFGVASIPPPGATPIQPTGAATVPRPPVNISLPISLPTAGSTLSPGLPPGPSPRVPSALTIPGSILNSNVGGIPIIALLGGGLLLVLLSGGRRRR